MIPASLILNLIAIGLILLQFDRSLALPPTQGGNLLENPGFEQPFGEGVAGGWQSWYTLTEKQDEQCLVAYHYQPKWNVETTASLIRDGASSQYIGNNWDTWAGGVYQTIPATPGTTEAGSTDVRSSNPGGTTWNARSWIAWRRGTRRSVSAISRRSGDSADHRSFTARTNVSRAAGQGAAM